MKKYIFLFQFIMFSSLMIAQDHSAIRDYQTLKFDYEKSEGSWWHRKIWHEPLLNKQKDSTYHLILNPIIDFSVGNDSDSEDYLFRNRRGLQLYGKLGKKFYFYTELIEEQARFANYINEFTTTTGVVPGYGVSRNPGNSVRDFGNSTGFISYKPANNFNLEYGYGKHFIGDGYRSFLLSDVSFPYTYFKATADVWKFKYFYLFAQQQDINAKGPDNSFIRKYNASHYLSYQVNEKLSFGFFESIIYHDSTRTRGIDLNYLNPVIFFRPMEFALGSQEGNVLIGINAKYAFSDKMNIYGQLMFDEFKVDELLKNNGWWANKYVIQLGFKYKEQFGAIQLNFQNEWNYARPYTFSHKISYQNYGHYNQALGHILGANFIENITFINAYYKRWFLESQFMIAVQGKDDSNQNWGSDIYQSYDTRMMNYGNEVLQGNTSNLLFINAKVGYTINPSYNLRVELSARYRSETFNNQSTVNQNTSATIFNFSVKTNLHKEYFDF